MATSSISVGSLSRELKDVKSIDAQYERVIAASILYLEHPVQVNMIAYHQEKAKLSALLECYHTLERDYE